MAESGEELITPEEAEQVQQVSGEVTTLVEQVNALMVRTQAEAEAAAEVLHALAARKRAAEELRLFLVTPLKRHAAAIDARFKPNRDALDAADRMVRRKVTDFRAEQEAARRAEQQRLEAERREREREAEEARRAAEAEAQRAREAAAREAAAAEEAARRVARERMEAMERDRESRRARIAALTPSMLERLAETQSQDGELARAELDARKRAREAQEAAARAAEAEQRAREAEAAARATPATDVVEVQAAAPARLAGVAERKRWTFEVVDAEKVPERFKAVNERALREWTNEQVRQKLRPALPGVVFKLESELAVRGR